MAKYNGPVCRLCRREGQKLFLKGERCFTDKCGIERRAFPPGQHGQKRTKLSEYGTQLREKQKVKRVYGLMEKQLRNTFDRAASERGVTSDIFFRNLECRLDNVVFRMGFARTRQEAKQLVRHNHFLVKGKRLNIPSAAIGTGDEIAVVEKSKSGTTFKLSSELYSKKVALNWFEVDHTKLAGKIISLPTREDLHFDVKERLIVELYNK